MKMEVKRDGIIIQPETEQDQAYLTDTLGIRYHDKTVFLKATFSITWPSKKTPNTISYLKTVKNAITEPIKADLKITQKIEELEEKNKTLELEIIEKQKKSNILTGEIEKLTEQKITLEKAIKEARENGDLNQAIIKIENLQSDLDCYKAEATSIEKDAIEIINNIWIQISGMIHTEFKMVDDISDKVIVYNNLEKLRKLFDRVATLTEIEKLLKEEPDIYSEKDVKK